MIILVTGASGFIGQKIVEFLVAQHTVVCLSRSRVNSPAAVFIQGAFDRFEDFRRLDEYRIDTVIHLAAVTGGCSEEDGLSVNVLGTRRLYRYLLDRGTTRFVTASSVAAVGCLNNEFLPQCLPIPDDHACFAKDAYGLSKAMVEEVTHYFQRLHSGTSFINLRFGAVVPDDSWTPQKIGADTKLTIPFVRLSHVYVSDIVDAVVKTVESPLADGVHTWNLVGPDSSCSIPTLDMLHSILGDLTAQYDLSYYEQPGNTHKPLFAMEKIAQSIGFIPSKSTRME